MTQSSAAARARRAALVPLMIAGAALVGAGSAGAGVVDPSVTTVPELLVPGDTTPTTVADEPTEDQAPEESGPTTTESDSGSVDEGLSASTKGWLIIAGLVGVAFLILVLTIIYWRHTSPKRVVAREAAARAAAPDPDPPPSAVNTPSPAPPGEPYADIRIDRPQSPETSVFAATQAAEGRASPPRPAEEKPVPPGVVEDEPEDQEGEDAWSPDRPVPRSADDFWT